MDSSAHLPRRAHNKRDGDEENDDDDDDDFADVGNGDDPSCTSIHHPLSCNAPSSFLSVSTSLAILVVPPPFLARASLARHRAFSRVLPRLPPSRSIRSLCTICLPFSVSNTTHGPPGGLVRGSILTAGVARTPILSVPANRRVSSKVSLHLLRRPSSSGHPRVTLHNHLRRHPL